ncbi:MAG: NYN domain-containing protein [Desulfobacteraceae bacterium]|nr:MAG: NYN domain-containing protein [Desulfobacteraceae bacterium]
MSLYHAHAFVDGGFLRVLAKEAFNGKYINPSQLSEKAVHSIAHWGGTSMEKSVALTRVIYYDAKPEKDEDLDSRLSKYWAAVELLPYTELGFGTQRLGTKKKPSSQKGVDTLMAVDMVVGAFSGIYQVAILIAEDSDFVPVINEIRRRGVMVEVVGREDRIADDLLRSADRFFPINPNPGAGHLIELKIE